MTGRQVSFTDGKCHHGRQENVVNYGGDVIAVRCSECTTILWHVGDCDGCSKKRWPLHKLVSSRKKRFCEEGCYQRWLKQKRAAALAK